MKPWIASIFILLASCHYRFSYPKSEEELFSRLAAASVLVRATTPAGVGFGSGTVIKQTNGGCYILTASHVVKSLAPVSNALSVIIKESELIREKYTAIVVAMDPNKDLALLFAYEMQAAYVLPVAEEEPPLYTTLYSLGAPLGHYRTANKGILSSKNKEIDTESVENIMTWQIPGVIWGMSGGTVANDRAELVCVPIAFENVGSLPYPDIGFCTGLPSIKEFLRFHLPN